MRLADVRQLFGPIRQPFDRGTAVFYPTAPVIVEPNQCQAARSCDAGVERLFQRLAVYRRIDRTVAWVRHPRSADDLLYVGVLQHIPVRLPLPRSQYFHVEVVPPERPAGIEQILFRSL